MKAINQRPQSGVFISRGVTLLLLGLLFFAATAASAGEPKAKAKPSHPDEPKPGPIPPLKRVVRLLFSDESHAWNLDILPDGSGRIEYGSGPPMASIPAGTFNFPELYRTLTANALPGGERSDSTFWVGFEEAKKTMVYAREVKDAKIIFGLFKTAVEKCQSEANPDQGGRIRNLWKSSPPKF